jgi:hypothetical protein
MLATALSLAVFFLLTLTVTTWMFFLMAFQPGEAFF